ncbi:MAG: YqgE/AlgH family protein [Acidobacteriota bacterium]
MAAATELQTPVFLLAMPQVDDVFFKKSVVLLVRHDEEEGSLGFIVNRPTELRVAEILEDNEIPWQGEGEGPHAFFGGPVNPEIGTLLYLASGASASGLPVSEDEVSEDRDSEDEVSEDRVSKDGVSEDERSEHAVPGGLESGDAGDDLLPGVVASQSLNDLETLARDSEGGFRLYLGYAGWGVGQLEQEILRNDWLIAPVDHELIFADDTDAVWRRAVESVGIEPDTLPAWTQGSEPVAN